jgi:putative Mg2+ transporter-C (MgtC) family protein
MEELTISHLELVLRLLATVGLCGLIGFERETRDQSAGFRTHILLGLGAALFTLVSAYGFAPFTAAALDAQGTGIRVDPTRIAAQVVAGIGFLGAGTIIRQGFDVRGLTTAASLWATAAIGMASGAGYYFGAAATTAVVLASLYLLRKVRGVLIPRLRTDHGVLELTFEDPRGDVSQVVEILERHDIRTRSLDAELGEGRAVYTLGLRIPPRSSVQETLAEVVSLPGVKKVSVSGLHDAD